MSFQQMVNRAYTTGFVGEIVRDGPQRARVGRILAPAVAAPNRIGRVFGYSEDLSVVGVNAASQTLAADAPGVVVGGPAYFGVLGHPKHHALQGVAGNALGPTYDLPTGVEAEFFSMATGLIVEIANQGVAAVDVKVDWALAYVTSATTAAQNPNGLELGTIVAYDPAGAVPDGFTPIPGSRVMNPISIAASAPGAVVAGVTWVSLTY